MGGPAVEASAGVRGIVGIGAQTFGGPKTFASKVSIANQGGRALDFLGVGDQLWWDNPSGGNPVLSGQNFLSQGALRSPNGPFVTDSATGFCIGGVNSWFSNAGIQALGQSYLADVLQAQTALPITVSSAKGASAGIVVKVGTTAAAHADAEVLRVAHSVGSSVGAAGTALMQVMGDGRCFIAGDLTCGTNLHTTVVRSNAGAANYINLHPSAGIYIEAFLSGLITLAPRVQLTGDLTAPARGLLSFTPQDAEPTGPNVVGDMYVTTAGVLKICTAAGSPGTWISVGAQA